MNKLSIALAVSAIIISSCAISQTTRSNSIGQTTETEVNEVQGLEEESNLKAQLLGEWEFHEITLRTPKDGYLIHISEQELKLMTLLIVNYSFNENGDVTFPKKYSDSLEIKNGKWLITDSGDLAITYFFIDQSKFNSGNTNKYETFTFKVVSISDGELTIDLQDMFIINFKRK